MHFDMHPHIFLQINVCSVAIPHCKGTTSFAVSLQDQATTCYTTSILRLRCKASSILVSMLTIWAEEEVLKTK